VIVAFGDSLTAGFGVDPGQSYPDYLQKQLDKKGLAYRVVNAGVSGETTTGALARVPAILAEKPSIVVVEFGGNDGLRGLPVTTTRANLDKIVDTIQKSGAKVLLAGMTLPPNYGPEYIGPFRKIYPELAAKYKVTLIPFLLQGVGGNPDLMQTDGIHPTAEGNRVVGDLVFQFIQKMLK
jgi:acyl-CoA thioesterase-1